MLETPKSAKTPSAGGIPNSCTTSAIRENGACIAFTFAPKIFSRSRAMASACASRSRLISLPEVNLSAIAAECPPAPSVASMYVPSGFTCSHSSTSRNITGVCAAPKLTHHRDFSNAQIFQRLVVLIRVRLVLQLIQHARVVHHFQIIEVAQHVHIALGLRRFPQNGWQEQPSLPIQFHRLPVIAGAHQKLPLRPVRARHFPQPVFNLRPNLHRINPGCLPGGAGDVKLVSVLLQLLQKHGGYLQTTLLVHLRWTVSPQLHTPRSARRPPFGWDRTRKCGLEWPKCPLSPQLTMSYDGLLLCPTAHYLTPLSPTIYHFAPHRTQFAYLVKRNRESF